MFCNDFCISVNKFSYGSTYRIGLLLLMGSVLTVCLTIGIVLCNARKIFDSKAIHKTRTKTVSNNKKQKSHSRDIKERYHNLCKGNIYV